MIENANTAKWYVVHTYSGYENKVKTNLEKIIENRGISHLITEVKIPVELTSQTNAEGVVKESESKLFPSYVFVKMVMTDETWHIVMTITGATGFVGPGSRPVPLTDKEVEVKLAEAREQLQRYAVDKKIETARGRTKVHYIAVVYRSWELAGLAVFDD